MSQTLLAQARIKCGPRRRWWGTVIKLLVADVEKHLAWSHPKFVRRMSARTASERCCSSTSDFQRRSRGHERRSLTHNYPLDCSTPVYPTSPASLHSKSPLRPLCPRTKTYPYTPSRGKQSLLQAYALSQWPSWFQRGRRAASSIEEGT